MLTPSTTTLVERRLCRFGHWHPPAVVKASTGNPNKSSEGSRPYHCPECSSSQNGPKVPGYWVTYGTLSAARDAGHLHPCRVCFPMYSPLLTHPLRTARIRQANGKEPKNGAPAPPRHEENRTGEPGR